MAYSKHHKVICSLFKIACVQPPTLLKRNRFLLRRVGGCTQANSKHHKALSGVLFWNLTLKTGWPAASSPVVPASFNVTSPVRERLGTRYRARFQASSFHLDSGNWPGDEAGWFIRIHLTAIVRNKLVYPV